MLVMMSTCLYVAHSHVWIFVICTKVLSASYTRAGYLENLLDGHFLNFRLGGKVWLKKNHLTTTFLWSLTEALSKFLVTSLGVFSRVLCKALHAVTVGLVRGSIWEIQHLALVTHLVQIFIAPAVVRDSSAAELEVENNWATNQEQRNWTGH